MIFRFKSVPLAPGFQSLTGSQSKFSQAIEHVLHLDVSDPINASEAQRLDAHLEELLEKMPHDKRSRSPYNVAEGVLKLSWGEKRHSRIVFREKAGNGVIELEPNELPKLGAGSVVGVGVELWPQRYERDGEVGVRITAYPNVLVIYEAKAADGGQAGMTELQEQTLSYLIDATPAAAVDGDF